MVEWNFRSFGIIYFFMKMENSPLSWLIFSFFVIISFAFFYSAYRLIYMHDRFTPKFVSANFCLSLTPRLLIIFDLSDPQQKDTTILKLLGVSFWLTVITLYLIFGKWPRYLFFGEDVPKKIVIFSSKTRLRQFIYFSFIWSLSLGFIRPSMGLDDWFFWSVFPPLMVVTLKWLYAWFVGPAETKQ